MYNFKFAHLNIRSLQAKLQSVENILVTGDYDVLALTETWLSSRIKNENVHIDNYIFIRRDRTDRGGGGVGMYIKSSYTFSILQTESHIEQLWISILLNKRRVAFGVTYRPDNIGHNAYVQFFNYFDETLSYILPTVDMIFCAGDLNIDLMNYNNPACKHLMSYLDESNLTQIISEPTRITGTSETLIDHIIVSNDDLIIDKGVVSVHNISDHELVYCKIRTNTQVMPSKILTYRDFSNLVTTHLHQI